MNSNKEVNSRQGSIKNRKKFKYKETNKILKDNCDISTDITL